MKHVVAVALTIGLSVAALADEPLRRVQITAFNPTAVAYELDRAGYDVLFGSLTDNTIDVIASEDAVAQLKQLGYEPQLIAVGRPFKEIERERDGIGDDVPDGYPTVDEIYAEMTAAAAAYPNICQMVNITEEYSRPQTYEGRDLFAIKISDNVTQREDEPNVLVVSCHHAREIVTPLIALYAIEQLTTQYGVDPNITTAVDNNEIWIAPMWNPDGYHHVLNVDNMWRKNRRVVTGGTGIDLNRNYPINWDSACGGSTDPTSLTYRGPSEGSEVETRTMIAWSNDVRFAKVIDFHSYGSEALYGYGCPDHPWETYLIQEATALAGASGYGTSIRPPSADGEHYQWQLALFGSHSNLVETHTEFQPSYASAMAESAQVWPGILWKIQREPSLTGHVLDAFTMEPIAASITFQGVAFQSNEQHGSGETFGHYYAFPPPGTYTLEFSAPGYETVTVSDVAITAGMTTTQDVHMIPPPQIFSPLPGAQLPINVPTTITWDDYGANLRYQVQTTDNFGDVGAVSEGFESGELSTAFTTGGAQPWYVTYSHPLLGQHAARAGDISHNQTSWMTRTVGGGTVSFWYYVSSEDGADFFNFYIDGQQEIHASGLTGWQGYSTTLDPGSYELKWEYTKNAMTSGNEDSVWIDYMQIVADQTNWTNVGDLTAPGVTSTTWTPTHLSDACKVRVRTYNPAEDRYGLWSEMDDVFSVVEGPVGCAGDANCDGGITWRDIDFFVAAMNDNVTAWEALFIPGIPTCPFANNDVNNDGTVSWRDIDPFVALMNTTCP